jgi:hypothetical protein
MRRAIERSELREAAQGHDPPFELFCERELESLLPELFDRVLGALDLIRRFDPRRFRRIERDVPRILVRRGGGAEYRELTRTCVLEAGDVQRLTAANLALAIVHEAAHARIFRRGVPYWPGLAERIEARCVKEQIAFTRRLGRAGWDVGPMLDHYQQRLAGRARTPEAMHAWRMRALRNRDAPGWLIRLVEVLGPPRGR